MRFPEPRQLGDRWEVVAELSLQPHEYALGYGATREEAIADLQAFLDSEEGQRWRSTKT